MSQRVSRFTAQRVDRPVLAPDWLIAVLTCMVAGGLWLLYPRQALERRLSETALGEVRSELTHLARVASLGALTASIAKSCG